MATHVTMTLGGIYRWEFDEKGRAWYARGRPSIRVQATEMRMRGGKTAIIWRLEPSGTPYHSYQQAMLAAEDEYGSRQATRTPRRRR